MKLSHKGFVDIYTHATLGATFYIESIGSVPVNNGIYSWSFGSNPGFGTLTDALTHAEAWLEVTINNMPLSPREKLVSVPYALKAANASSVRGTVVLENGFFSYARSRNDPLDWDGL